MAALYGRLKGQAGEVTRLGSAKSGIAARLETWDGAVSVELDADGTFCVYVGPKHGFATEILRGNINDPDERAKLTRLTHD